MSHAADKAATPEQDPNSLTGDLATPVVVGHHTHPVKKFLYAHWTDQAARTTALLAVLAAVASSQYALQISRAILSQAEATDQWNYYSAKSIKKHLTVNEASLMNALLISNPQLKPQLQPLLEQAKSEAARYDKETKELKQSAEQIDTDKHRQQKKGDRFQYAFLALQAGVVLCTIASSSRKKALWLLAVIAGVLGLLTLGDAYLLIV
jgi:hypothetical protein